MNTIAISASSSVATSRMRRSPAIRGYTVPFARGGDVVATPVPEIALGFASIGKANHLAALRPVACAL